MSDKNNNQDSFEKFFQEKAEKYDISYNEEDWLKLEKKLDLLDKERAHIQKQFLAVAAAILVFSLLAYFTYENYMKINRLSEQLNDRQVTEVQPSPQNLPANKSDKAKEPKMTGENDNRDENAVRQEEKPARSSPSNLAQNPTAGFETTKYNSIERGAQDNQFLVSTKSVDELLVSELSCSGCSLESTDQFSAHSNSVLANAKYAAGNVETEKGGSDAIISAKNQAVSEFPRFSAGFLMAPDLSTVGSVSNFHNPGYKMGLTVEYNFNRNFAISTGIVRSTVRYIADGNEYSPPSGFWAYNNAANETIAECVILGIPLNFKYNVLHLKNSRFFATAGISSYIMLSEDYRFNYDRNGNNLAPGWSGRTGTRHWMSNAGFSIGYELDILKNVSLRAEPYIKIPLRKVGWGNVKLYSVGTFISFNYNL